MTIQTGNLIESTEWRNMEDFSEGIDTNRLPQSEGLGGTTTTVTLADGGGSFHIAVDAEGKATWTSHGIEWLADGSGPADVVQFLAGAYWVDITTKGDLPQTVTTVFHPERRWALSVHTVVHGEDFTTETRVMQEYHP